MPIRFRLKLFLHVPGVQLNQKERSLPNNRRSKSLPQQRQLHLSRLPRPQPSCQRHARMQRKSVITFIILSSNIPMLIITKVSGKRNPIYLFYEEVKVNEQGEVGEAGDKHYKCYHGNRKTFTITKAMNYSLNGMFFEHGMILNH